jgi:LuxR family maltose regulon positive regulatory protein
MIGTGRLHETHRLTQQAGRLGTLSGGLRLPDVCWPAIFQAEVLREWNQLDAALELVEEAISLSPQTTSMLSITYSVYGYAVLIRIALSRGELDTARSALQQYERITMNMNLSYYSLMHSLFTTIDQVRLWLACGELDRATRWAEKLDWAEHNNTPFAREREEVARVHILLAKKQPEVALQRLEPVLQRVTTGQRWGHVIEIRLLQTLAHQMCQQDIQALGTLSEAVRLAEPEGYIRSFVDQGTPIEALVYQLRKRECRHGPTPYLDTVIAAFQQESMARVPVGEAVKVQLLPDPLSERELEVLQLLAHGVSNQEIAQ